MSIDNPNSYEKLGFDSFLRKDDSNYDFDFGTEISRSDVGGVIGDLVITDDQVTELRVSKLRSGTIESQSIVLGVLGGSGDVEVRSGIAAGDFTNSGAATGFIFGVDDSDSDKVKFYWGSPTNHFSYDGTTVSIVGTLTASSIHIPDQDTTASSFHVQSDGDSWWGATETSFNADNNNAAAYVLKTGVAKFQSVSLVSNVVISGIQAGSAIGVEWLSAGTISSKSIVLGVIGGTGDVEIRAGIASGDFANSGAASGFILGVDDSDSDKAKFYIGSSPTNSMIWDGATLTVNGSTIAGQAWFGNGNDGDVTISGNTTLTADMFYNNLTVNTGVTLTTAGYRVFVKVTLTTVGTGKIDWIGNNGGNGGDGEAYDGGNSAGGVAGTAAAALADGFLSGSVAGKAGGGGGIGKESTNGEDGGAATAGNNVSIAIGTDGNAGGTGGAGGSANGFTGGAGGATAAGGTATVATTKPFCAAWGVLMLDFSTPATPAKYTTSASGSSASGGGGGGAGQTGAGGGGGGSASPGGVGVIAANIIVNAGTISYNGGIGGNGGNGGNGSGSGGNNGPGGGGGGGGAGGNGGVLLMIYNRLTNTGTIECAAGTGGTKGIKGASFNTATAAVDGADGAAGDAGVLIQLAL